MTDSFDAIEYLGYLRRRRSFLFLTISIALAAALGISLVLPNKYTATSRLIIDPPAGSDQRVATAVSPIYLESLRTYEHFASSDSLFLRAMDHFKLHRQGGRSIESWKRSVLTVEMPRNTRILAISATLPDARLAHALALFLAGETLKLSRSVNREGDEQLLADLEGQVAGASGRLREAEIARARQAGDPAEQLAGEIRSAEYSLALVDEQLLKLEVETTPHSARAGVELLRRQRDQLRAEIARKQHLLAERTAREDDLFANLKAARAAFDAADTRRREFRSTVGFRGEQLKMLDGGIVPERPSSPNLPLHLAAAFLLALIGSLAWLTLGFVHERTRERTGEGA